MDGEQLPVRAVKKKPVKRSHNKEKNIPALKINLPPAMTEEEMDAHLKAVVAEKQTGKWTAEDVALRREAITAMYRKGWTKTRCIDEMRTRWGCMIKSAREWTADVDKYLVSIYVSDKDRITAELIEKLGTLAEKAVDKGEIKNAASIYNIIARITGIGQPEQVTQVQVNNVMKFDFGTN